MFKRKLANRDVTEQSCVGRSWTCTITQSWRWLSVGSLKSASEKAKARHVSDANLCRKQLKYAFLLKPIQHLLFQATDIRRDKVALWGLNEQVMALWYRKPPSSHVERHLPSFKTIGANVVAHKHTAESVSPLFVCLSSPDTNCMGR